MHTTIILYFSLQLLAVRLFLTTIVNSSKITSYHIEQLFRKICAWSFIKLPWIIFTYLLTYPMVQSPSWQANLFAASQEIPRISWNPKVHYRTHKRPPPVSILDQPNPVHIHISHLLEIHSNIIHPSTPRSPQWSRSLSGFPSKTLHTSSPQPYALHTQPISFFSILSPAQYWVRSTNNLAPRYAISSILPLLRPS